MELPQNIKSIQVMNTGLGNDDIDIEITDVEWITEKRIRLKQAVECVMDSAEFFGTEVSEKHEFEYSYTERDSAADPYVLITCN